MGTLTPRSINFMEGALALWTQRSDKKLYPSYAGIYYAIYRFVHVSFLCPETVLEIKIVMEGFIIIYRKMKKFFYN